MNRAWPVFFIWTQVQARLEDGLRTAANYVSTQYFVLMIGCFRHACFWRFLGLIISCRDTTQWEEIVFQGAFLFSWDAYDAWILDVLWGQPIKLAWVASTSELLENQLNNLVFFKKILFISAGPQKPQKLTASKIKYESFGPKFSIPLWKMDILAP